MHRLSGLLLLFVLLPQAFGQFGSVKVVEIKIQHVGPPSVSDELVRSNVRVKVGDSYQSPLALQTAVDDDVRNLYGTGFFYNIRVSQTNISDGVVLTYIVQGKPRLTEIKFHGNKKYSDSKLRRKLTSKAGEPLNEQKLFTDSQEIQKTYQKAGYPRTEVKYVLNLDEAAGRGTATFEITESPKVKIVEVEFVGAKAFKQRKLRKVVKTRRHWMFSWITGSGYLKDEEFEEDRERLATFYRDHGYIDFEIKDVQFLNPSPRKMIIRWIVYEGTQYKVGSVKFSGNKLFTTNDIAQGMRTLYAARGGKKKLGPNGLSMDVGDTFTPKGYSSDVEAVEDFYGSKGYIDVTQSARNLIVTRVPNTEAGTIDLEFQIDEGQKSYVEKIEIRGNTKTKDRVIRRELAVSPGEVFDMVRVKVSKSRLQGLNYFEKVDARPEPTDPPIAGHKNLLVSVEEKNTGNLTMGAGFSSVDSIVGFVELSQGNFDLFHPPTFTGGGQKFRLRVQIGTQRQDYIMSFIEPWFLGRKLALGTEFYYRDLNFQSLENIYDEVRAGGRVSLTRTLGSDFLIGSLSYTLEDIGIKLNSGFHGPLFQASSGGFPGNPGQLPGPSPGGWPTVIPANVPSAILAERGDHLLSRFGFSLAYDTRNSTQLPDKGQRTELFTEFVGGPLGGDKEFYRVELRTAWYVKGFFSGHVLELGGRVGVVDSLQSGVDVPFYERYYLGGLNSLRGFKYRSISPREPGFSEPIGGDTYWFGYAEYSIPIIERLRFAVFYDVGEVESQPYNFGMQNFDDDWGIGLRLNLPIGPLRLDYGIPLQHDRYNKGGGQFQFGVGYTREF